MFDCKLDSCIKDINYKFRFYIPQLICVLKIYNYNKYVNNLHYSKHWKSISYLRYAHIFSGMIKMINIYISAYDMFCIGQKWHLNYVDEWNQKLIISFYFNSTSFFKHELWLFF